MKLGDLRSLLEGFLKAYPTPESRSGSSPDDTRRLEALTVFLEIKKEESETIDVSYASLLASVDAKGGNSNSLFNDAYFYGNEPSLCIFKLFKQDDEFALARENTKRLWSQAAGAVSGVGGAVEFLVAPARAALKAATDEIRSLEGALAASQAAAMAAQESVTALRAENGVLNLQIEAARAGKAQAEAEKIIAQEAAAALLARVEAAEAAMSRVSAQQRSLSPAPPSATPVDDSASGVAATKTPVPSARAGAGADPTPSAEAPATSPAAAAAAVTVALPKTTATEKALALALRTLGNISPSLLEKGQAALRANPDIAVELAPIFVMHQASAVPLAAIFQTLARIPGATKECKDLVRAQVQHAEGLAKLLEVLSEVPDVFTIKNIKVLIEKAAQANELAPAFKTSAVLALLAEAKPKPPAAAAAAAAGAAGASARGRGHPSFMGRRRVGAPSREATGGAAGAAPAPASASKGRR